MKLVFAVTVVAAGAYSSGAPVTAFSTLGPKWASSSVNYYVNPSNPWVSSDDALAAIQQAASTWSTQSNANVQLVYAGPTNSSSISMNYKNEVFFRNDGTGNTATTYWWYDGGSRLLDTDIVFWTNYRWYTHATGCSDGFYIENTGAHEFGHALGLGHSEYGTATMWSSTWGCMTDKETLDPDDITAIQHLYPSSGGSGGGSTAPSAPSQMSASPNQANPTTGLIATWVNGSSASDGVRLERSSNGSAFAEIAILPATANWYADQGLTPGTAYSYRARAFKGTAMSVYSNVASGQTEASSEAAPPPPPPPPPSSVTLSARGYKTKGVQRADLSWSGVTTQAVDIFRNGSKVTTTANDGVHTDPINKKGGGSYTYKLCSSDGTACSNQVSVTF
jgi:hypothetical protein